MAARNWLGALALMASVLGGAAEARDRTLKIDLAGPSKPRDRMADLSIGSDYPGTLYRQDSLAQLATVQKELRFRYIRFHAIFHDVFGTYTEVDGKPVYDWTKIDLLYDELLKLGLKPFVELGFTPWAMSTSNNQIFYWKGNTSHPVPAKWDALVEAFIKQRLPAVESPSNRRCPSRSASRPITMAPMAEPTPPIASTTPTVVAMFPTSPASCLM